MPILTEISNFNETSLNNNEYLNPHILNNHNNYYDRTYIPRIPNNLYYMHVPTMRPEDRPGFTMFSEIALRYRDIIPYVYWPRHHIEDIQLEQSDPDEPRIASIKKAKAICKFYGSDNSWKENKYKVYTYKTKTQENKHKNLIYKTQFKNISTQKMRR